MNKKLIVMFVSALAIATASHASEGEETSKSASTKAAEAVKTAISFVGNVIKGTANCPNTVSHYFGYGETMKTWQQFGIAAAFWALILSGAKKAYETYKKEQEKKMVKRMIDDALNNIENNEDYEVVER